MSQIPSQIPVSRREYAALEAMGRMLQALQQQVDAMAATFAVVMESVVMAEAGPEQRGLDAARAVAAQGASPDDRRNGPQSGRFSPPVFSSSADAPAPLGRPAAP